MRWKGEPPTLPSALSFMATRHGTGVCPFSPQVDPLRVVQPPPLRPGPVPPPGEPVLPWQQPLVSSRGLHAAGLRHRPSSLVHPLCQWRLVSSGAQMGLGREGRGRGAGGSSCEPRSGRQGPWHCCRRAHHFCLPEQTTGSWAALCQLRRFGGRGWACFVPAYPFPLSAPPPT